MGRIGQSPYLLQRESPLVDKSEIPRTKRTVPKKSLKTFRERKEPSLKMLLEYSVQQYHSFGSFYIVLGSECIVFITLD
jgi:hypothetical protein